MGHKKHRIPTRQLRLEQAQNWLKTYAGKNLVRGYQKRFNVPRLSALIELQVLGQPISDETIDAARLAEGQTQQVCARQKARAHLARFINSYRTDQDERFAYIAGYTSGGFPFGTTWEEMDAMVMRKQQRRDGDKVSAKLLGVRDDVRTEIDLYDGIQQGA